MTIYERIATAMDSLRTTVNGVVSSLASKASQTDLETLASEVSSLVQSRQRFTTTASQTTFNILGNPMTDPLVFLDGMLLEPDDATTPYSFTATVITFTNPLTAGRKVVVIN